MKYSDCPTTSAMTSIDASAGAVWGLVSDIALPTRFSPEVESVEWLAPDTAPRAGARFAGHNRHPAIGGWRTECVVTAFEPERRFEWCVGDPDHPSSVWRFTITPRDDGTGVDVEQWFQMGPARSGLNGAIDAMPDKEERIIERRLAEHRTNMEANLAGLKRLVEHGEHDDRGDG